MKRKNNSEVFLQKIFERSENPIGQLERINSIVPVFFANEKNIAFANERLDSYGYQINDDYVSEMRNQIQMLGHPACGNGYPSGGYGHPACGNGYPSGGYGHPACGNGYPSGGYGHPACCSSKNESGKSLLLIRKNNGVRHNEIRN
ncbi:MAG: hypothetical protein NC181_03625 [Clostridium sp.]|nr:hypothetical protein [Clostridium sp.]MCM1444398.1 hypothetical protein [Candidatus Amulumruptor caecigallinarius]